MAFWKRAHHMYIDIHIYVHIQAYVYMCVCVCHLMAALVEEKVTHVHTPFSSIGNHTWVAAGSITDWIEKGSHGTVTANIMCDVERGSSGWGGHGKGHIRTGPIEELLSTVQATVRCTDAQVAPSGEERTSYRGVTVKKRDCYFATFNLCQTFIKVWSHRNKKIICLAWSPGLCQAQAQEFFCYYRSISSFPKWCSHVLC